jgi:radical SAM superfamily enzyme YgiQ (UPF0313 family)
MPSSAKQFTYGKKVTNNPVRILLISPPWLEIYGYYKKAAKIGCVSPPLGLTYLGGAIINAGHECKIVDMEPEKINVEKLLTIISEYKPQLIGITATTPIFNNAKYIAKSIKSKTPRIPLCIGGVHSTIIGKDVLKECPYFNFQVIGEGEQVIIKIINSLEQNKSLHGIAGCNYYEGDEIIENPKNELISDLDTIPKPARELLNINLYKHYLPKIGYVKYASLFTSRGCPFKCVFCSQHTMYGRQVRNHSISRVIDELKYITDHLNIKHVIFMDETLTLNKSRVIELCESIKKTGLKFTWEGWTHASTIDEELLGLMKSTGLIRLSFGIESGDPYILKKIKKGITLNDIRKAYHIAEKVGVETRGSAMIGHPFETKKTAWKTIKFCRSIKECKQLFLNVATPYPGTELYEYARNNKAGMKLLTEDYSKYKRYGEPIIEVNDLNSKELKRLQAIGLLYFYCAFHRIYYNIFKRSTLKDGIINAFAFLIGIISSVLLPKNK